MEKLTPERDLSRHPLVQVVFQLVNLPPPGPALLGDARTEPFDSRTVFTRTDLEVYFSENAGGGIDGRIQFSRTLFETSTIERLSRHMTEVLRSVVEAPDRPFSRMQLMDVVELRQALADWNDTAVQGRLGPCPGFSVIRSRERRRWSLWSTATSA